MRSDSLNTAFPHLIQIPIQLPVCCGKFNLNSHLLSESETILPILNFAQLWWMGGQNAEKTLGFINVIFVWMGPEKIEHRLDKNIIMLKRFGAA